MLRRAWGLLLAASLAAPTACTADATDEEVEDQDSAATASAAAAGVREGTFEAEGVLLLVNDRTVTADTLRRRTKLTSSVARAIVGFRTTPKGAPRWFQTVAEIDALPSTGRATFERLLADARANDYVEKEGFDAPEPHLVVPEGLGRPPTSNDVTVEAGHDGLSPEEVFVLARGRVTNAIDPSKERLLRETVIGTHKAFTLAVNNLFAPGSPVASFFSGLRADRITVLGAVSALKPVTIVVEKGGKTAYYQLVATGTYGEVSPPSYATAMRARVRMDPPGVRVFYPAFSVPQLAP